MTLTAYSKSLKAKSFLIITVFIAFSNPKTWGQINDSSFVNTKEKAILFEEYSTLDPNKAAIYSAILPGLGQIYNGQYFTVPLIYGVFLGLVHGIRYSDGLYNDFTNALRAEEDGDPNTINGFGQYMSVSNLERNRETVRRNRDYLIIWTVALYLVQVAHAHIAAHLHEFEINEGLSMKLKPKFETSPVFSRSVGITLALNF